MSNNAIPPSTEARETLARAFAHHRAGRTAEARRDYQHLVKTQPNFARAWHLYGTLLAQTGQAAEAVEAIRRAAALQPDDAACFNDLGNAYLNAGHATQAIEAYGRAIEAKPGFVDAHANRARALRWHGDLEAALADYDRVIALDPRAHRAMSERGIILLNLHRYDDALSALQAAVAVEPRDPTVQLNLGYGLHQVGLEDEALSAFEAAIALEPRLTAAHVVIGALHHDAERAAPAKAAFERAIAIDPRCAEALAGLSALAHDAGDFHDSARLLDRVLELQPDNVSAWVNMGLIRLESGAAKLAVEAFRRALKVNPREKRAQAHLAIALQHCGDRSEAAAILDFERLISVRDLDSVDGWPSVAAFNEALVQRVLENPTLMRARKTVATNNGDQSLEVLVGNDPITRGLRGAIETEVRRYIAETLATSDNVHANQATKTWRLSGWAVVLRSGGFQSPHIHPEGFASGVYYARIPACVREGSADQAGYIKFGQSKPWAEGAESQADFLARAIAPMPGRMVLFPSHFWHHTVPFESEERRICVAFDVLPV